MFKEIVPLGLLVMSFSLFPMNKTKVDTVLIVPMQFRADTKEWYLLLGQDTGEAYGGFKKKLVRETPDQATVKTLVNQTNGVYNDKNFTLDTAYKVETPLGEMLYFVNVPFIPDADLKKKGATKRFKSDFRWVRVETLLKSKGDFTPSGSTKPVYPGFVEKLKKYLPDALQSLPKPIPATSSQSVSASVPITTKAVQSSSSATATSSKAHHVTNYTHLAQFVLDNNPHEPSEKESLAITPMYEDLVDRGIIDNFLIRYEDLRHQDGSTLTEKEKKEIIDYLEANDHHADDMTLRLANNNIHVLAQGTHNPQLKNKVWSYVHRYMRSLPKLVEELKQQNTKAR